MSVVLLRADNRLIHGQIVQGWLPSLEVDEVAVISDAAAQSAFAAKMMRLSLPPQYGLKILAAKDAARYLHGSGDKKIFVIAESLSAIAALLESGMVFNAVNIGNTEFKEGKKKFSEGVYLSPQEETLARALAGKGIKLDVRTLPSSLPAGLF
jgi:PTS system mannose-specific IIB component